MKGKLTTETNVTLFLLLALFLVACGPEKRIQWSPDGKKAAVLADGNLILADEQGNLSAPVAEGVTRMSWLPDSTQALVVIEKKVRSWDEVVRLVPNELKEKEIAAAAQAVTEELVGYSGKIDDFKPSNAAALTGEQWAAALLYAKSQADPRLKSKLGEKDWKEFEELEVDVSTLRLITTASSKAGDGRTLLTTMSAIEEPRISPDGAVAALVTKHTRGWFGPEEWRLSVISLAAGGAPVQIADRVARFPDWTPDGSSVVFVQSEREQAGDSSGDSIGIVGRRTIRDKTGAVMAELQPAVSLAKVLFQDGMKLRCLRSGRILFSAQGVSLPVAVKDFPGRMSLFEIQPGATVTVKRLLQDSVEQGLPDRIDLFELSPDETRIAVPGSKGKVSVISLGKGEVEQVVDKDGPNDIPTIPVWRNNDQLCLVVPPGSPMGSGRRAEIVLWGMGQPRIVSQQWPESAIPWLK